MEDLITSTDFSQLSQSSSDGEEMVFFGGPEPKRSVNVLYFRALVNLMRCLSEMTVAVMNQAVMQA